MRSLFKKLNIKKCITCGAITAMYINKPSTRYYKWCKSCRKKCFKNKIDWTSGNDKIDNLIHAMQLKIKYRTDEIFELIPYNQFDNIKIIRKGNFSTAKWKDGPLYWDSVYKKYKRDRYWNKRIVVLKCLDNEVFDSEVFDSKEFDSEEFDSKEFSNKFLNKVTAYLIYNPDKILRVYGISQDPDTKNYIMVLQKKRDDNDEIEEQFKEAEKYRNTNRIIKSTFHPQAIYTSRLLNSFTKDLPEYIDDYTQCINNRTECLDCAI
ncbi:uncharacterized protein OCT59_008018 [Rhizophagus irregularis]|uniref:uncharacterized protein n=1 Tax=Rhizophagus irregularis TaxID=588596 RepID=UPI00331DF6B1|nr:hypothetical protein OCT59_008018 [Rhizophagus irregularis]